MRAIAAALAAALLVAAGRPDLALAQTAPRTAAPATELTIEDILARLRVRESELGFLARGSGDPVLPNGDVRAGGVVLALPVQYARVGYLQHRVRVADGDQAFAPGEPVFAPLLPFGEKAARRRTWCTFSSADGQQPRTVSGCFEAPAGEDVQPLVREDPAAAAAFPPIEIVYSFSRWSGRVAHLERGVRVDGRIAKLAELRVRPEPDGSVLLREAGGAVQLRRSADGLGASAAIVEPFETEAQLRAVAEAIWRCVQQPPGPCISFSDQLIQLQDAKDLYAEFAAGRVFARLYPEEAMDRRLNGETSLGCVVQADRRLRCFLLSETPEGWGFGFAALMLSREFRVVERLPDGRATLGGAIHLPIRFRLPNGAIPRD